MLQVRRHREPPETRLVENVSESCISGWSYACHPYIESATALSDYVDDEDSQEFPVFRRQK